MNLYSRSLLLLLLNFQLFSIIACSEPSAIEPVTTFNLSRVTIPDQQSIQTESLKADARSFRKYAVVSTVVISSIVGLYLLYQISEAAREHDKEQRKDFTPFDDSFMEKLKKNGLVLVKKYSLPINFFPDNEKTPSSPEQGWLSRAGSGVKSFGLKSGKFFADSAFMLASGTVLKGCYDYFHNKISQTYVDETVLWYMHEHTQIPLLFNDLKTYATDYDLFASFLSVDLFNQEAQMHFKAFVTDLLGATQAYMHNEAFRDPSYYSYLLEDMKKKYVKKGQQLEKLSDYVVDAAAKRNRMIAHDHAEMLFANDMNRRADIAQMCNLLAYEVEKLTAFIELRGGLRHKSRICDIVDTCNKFLDHMEMLLNSSSRQLQVLSSADQGMFTSIYEYEKIFGEQVNFLHRYCRFI